MGPIVLRGSIFPALYERLYLLSYFTRLLLSSNIFVNEADKLIKKFLRKIEEIYGPHVFSPNVHSLNHLSWQVKNRPLWCISAIMFESANYVLKTKFTGTVNHLRLIVERYNRKKDQTRIALIFLQRRICRQEFIIYDAILICLYFICPVFNQILLQ